MTLAHLSDEICAFHAAEMARRRKYWIAGVPDPVDMAAVDKCVAGRLKVTVDDVRKALSAVATAPDPEP